MSIDGCSALLLFTMTFWISPIFPLDQDGCPSVCRCKPKQLSARCLNENDTLRRVPKLPSYVRKLYIDSNEIPNITNSTFDNLSLMNLTLLSVKSCQVRLITENAFGHLIHLETLDLGSNVKLNVSSLKLALKSLQKTDLKRLCFDHMQWKTQQLSMGIFEYLTSYKVQTLTLIGNVIQSWTDTASVGLKTLSKLFISRNKIMTCKHLSTLTSLEHIDLSNNLLPRCDMKMLPQSLVTIQLSKNNLRKFPKLCTNDGKTVLLPRLKKLYLDYNNINEIRNIFYSCFPSLTHLSLSGNDIKRLSEKAFTSMPKLLYLQLEKMKEGVNVIKLNAFDIPSLKKLFFSQNNFNFKSKRSRYSISFGTCKNLEVLDLSYNRMSTSATNFRKLLSGLFKLKELRLQSVGWTVIPDKLFHMFPNIEKVWLSHNGISNIGRNLFPVKMKLKILYLNDNGFSNLSPGAFPKSFWKFIQRIDLSGNPYACNCGILWFRNKLKSSSPLFHPHLRKYICSSPTELRGLQISMFNITDEDCRTESVLLIALSSTLSTCVFVGLVAFGFYLARWHIRYWIYLLRYKRSGLKRYYGDNHEYKYDVFVSYAHEDDDFVHNILLNKLEDENGYRLCIHARDFEAGRMIVDNIAENITSSRQVLMVMSESFCRSKWCKFEQLIALDRWLNNESEPIVIIMLEEIHSKNVNKNIKILLSTTTYVQWTLNDTAKEVFWNHLLASLKR